MSKEEKWKSAKFIYCDNRDNYTVHDIPEYFASDKGRIATTNSNNNAKTNTIISINGKTAFLKSQRINSGSGYYSINYNKKSYSVHTIIASTFIKIPDNVKKILSEKDSLTVDHKNNDKFCNYASNLQWLSKKQNNAKQNNAKH